MRLWSWFVIAAIASAVTLSSPSQFGRFGGTFIGAVVCEDGIVVASDSRSTFEDAMHRPVGFVDGMTKVFVRQGAAFAVSGLTNVGDDLFPSFVRQNQFLLDRQADEMLFGVSLWLPFRNSTNVLLISAGYVANAPMICARGPSSPQVCRHAGYVTNKDSASFDRWYVQNHNVAPKAREAAAALKQAILESGAVDRTVGGPVTILELHQNAPPQWIENPPYDDGWNKVCDLANAYRQGRAKITSSNSKEELDRYLGEVCPVSR